MPSCGSARAHDISTSVTRMPRPARSVSWLDVYPPAIPHAGPDVAPPLPVVVAAVVVAVMVVAVVMVAVVVVVPVVVPVVPIVVVAVVAVGIVLVWTQRAGLVFPQVIV